MSQGADILPQLLGRTRFLEPSALLPGSQPFSESEKQIFEHLWEAGASRECLLSTLKNRLKHYGEKHEALASAVTKFPEPIAEHKELSETTSTAHRKLSSTVKRIAYVLNPFPDYQLPGWLRKSPPLNQSLVAASRKKIPASLWDHLHALHKVQGMRLGISIHRIRAITAIVTCLLATMNVSSLRCFVCVKSIAAHCGLTTSRVSRALKDLANVGLLTKKLQRTLQGHYQPLAITLSRKTLRLFGVSEARLNHAQKMHKKCSKAAHQTITKAKSVIGSVAQSLANFKRALKLKPRLSKPNELATIVKRVEETLQVFGLGRECPFSPG